MFRKKAISYLIISALLLPFIFLVPESTFAAALAFFLIALQLLIILEFSKAEKLEWEHWIAFWSALLTLCFALLLAFTGRTLFSEFMALLLFLFYFIIIIILLFSQNVMKALKSVAIQRRFKKDKDVGEEDLESFRKKDELKELVEFFEAEEKPEADYVEIKEPSVEKIILERLDEEAEKKQEEPDNAKRYNAKKIKEEELEIDDDSWRKIEEVLEELEQRTETTLNQEELKSSDTELPKSVVFDYSEEEKQKGARSTKEYETPEIIELKEAPKIDFEKVKEDLAKIDDGVKTLNEKIKEITEQAIKEGEERKRIANALKKIPKPKKKELVVYASKNGGRFHYNKGCLGLKRVSRKNIVTYSNSAEARKKNLKPCRLCK